MNTWTVQHELNGDRHIVPLRDYRPHVLTAACWCRPDDDGFGVFAHNSMDGREDFETGKRRPS